MTSFLLIRVASSSRFSFKPCASSRSTSPVPPWRDYRHRIVALTLARVFLAVCALFPLLLVSFLLAYFLLFADSVSLSLQ